MKTKIYSFALICFFLLTVSCQKDASINPTQKTDGVNQGGSSPKTISSDGAPGGTQPPTKIS